MKTPAHCYQIVRYYADGRKPVIIKSGLTLDQAQGHCSSDTTHKPGEWFHGYRKTPGIHAQKPRSASITNALLVLYGTTEHLQRS